MSTGLLSIVVSTYNRPRHLQLALAGIAREHAQRPRPIEIVVADDGSGPETAAVIEEHARAATYRVAHVWQEDAGFRAARIRNLGVRATHGERILFLDGDCVPLPGFLQVHGAAVGSDRILAGTRLFLDQEPSERLTRDDITRGALEREVPRAELARLRWIATKNIFYRRVLRKDRPKVVTANLSLPAHRFESVNGLDERFVGWGFEDDDLRRRLVRRGYTIDSVFTAARVCHLWHTSVESFPGRVRDTANIDYFKRGYFLARCRRGLAERSMNACAIAWNTRGLAGEKFELAVAWGARPLWPRRSHAEVRVYVAGAPAEQSAMHAARAHIALVPAGESGHAGHAETNGARARDGGSFARIPYVPPLDPETADGRRRILELLDPHL